MVTKQLYAAEILNFFNIASKTSNYYVTTAECFIA